MKAKEWLDIPNNQKRYNEWRNDTTTKEIISVLREECEPRLLPRDWLDGKTSLGEMALLIHGQHTGESRLLRKMENLDEEGPVPQEVVASFQAEKYLVDQGYTENDARRMVKKMEEEGI